MIGDPQKTCCFIGHRRIEGEKALWETIHLAVERLIGRGVEEFIFGDRSEFNDLCNKVVAELQETYPQIRRIQFRVTYPVADAYTLRLVQGGYDESYFPEEIRRAGRAAYVERNRAMIRTSRYCIFYYNPLYTPRPCRRPKKETSAAPPMSGTQLAYQYAQKKRKILINLYPTEQADEVR